MAGTTLGLHRRKPSTSSRLPTAQGRPTSRPTHARVRLHRSDHGVRLVTLDGEGAHQLHAPDNSLERGSRRCARKSLAKQPGTRHRITLLAEQLMADDAEGVVLKVVEAAKAGDMTAARLVLDRIVPLRKGRPVTIDLPEVTDAVGIVAALAAVIAAMGDGTLSPDEAAAVSSVIEGQRRAIETAELEARLRAIEEKIGESREVD
jgi:hypothetical protein